MEFKDVDISEVVFKERLTKRKFCAIFLVVVRGQTCVLKVHRNGTQDIPCPPGLQDRRVFVCEARAYRRLAEAGLCAQGVVPKFYGTIDRIDPSQCQPHLDSFAYDDYLPTGILMEYIPNMVELHWSNYTPERMQSLVDTMEQMHAAKVLHNDIHPRNMMILEDDPKRAIWIDFDRAQTYGETLTELEESWFATEKAIVYEMARFMKHDHEKGAMDKTEQYY